MERLDLIERTEESGLVADQSAQAELEPVAQRTDLADVQRPGEVRLVVSDNGHGSEVPNSPAEFTPGGHFGLLGLYERAELIGAR